MKTTLVIAVALVVCGSESAVGSTVNRADLNRVVACMKTRSCRGTIFAKQYYGLGEQIVFVANGRRYTFVWYREENSLSIWVRPEGNKDQASVSTFSDEQLDGNVDFGITGSIEQTDTKRKYFRNTKAALGSNPKGLEFQDYWNEQYAVALSAACRRFDAAK